MSKTRRISTEHPGVWQLGARSRILALWYQLAVLGYALVVCLLHEGSWPAAVVIVGLMLRDLVRIALRWRRRLDVPTSGELLLPWMAWIVVDALVIMVVLPKLAPSLLADDQALSLLALGYGLVILLQNPTKMHINGYTVPAGFTAICSLEFQRAPGWLGTWMLLAIGVIFLALARIVFLRATARLADQTAAAEQQKEQRADALINCLIALSNMTDAEQQAPAGQQVFDRPWPMGALIGSLVPALEEHGRIFIPTVAWKAEIDSHLAPSSFDLFFAVVLEATQQGDGVEVGYPQLTRAGHAIPVTTKSRSPYQPDLSAFADRVLPAGPGSFLFLTGSTGGTYVSR